MQPLTVETLSEAPRDIINVLDELRIRCEFFHRGCSKTVELGELERHVKECGFVPAFCSNEGCNLEMNKHELIHHETAVCEHRKATCQNCMNEIRQEMDSTNKKLDENEKKIEEKLKINEERLKAVEQKLVAKIELVQGQLNKQEINNLHVQEDIVDMKKSLNEITKQLERMTQQTSYEAPPEQGEMKKGIAEADDLDKELKVVVAGGRNNYRRLNSVEMFNLSTGTWTQLQPMKECRSQASSVVYNNHVIVAGGYGKNGAMKSMERLSRNAAHARQSISWEELTVELPGRLHGHCIVVFNRRLIVIGGCDQDRYETSLSISEVSLASPHTSKCLATLAEKIYYHGVARFYDKIVIVGGKNAPFSKGLKTVVMYDITRNECHVLAPLPYPVSGMATVKWGDDHFIIIGGHDSNWKPLSKVLIYNIKTQKCHMLPDMKYKRVRCVAAVVRGTVIVIGGEDERNNFLKSVECFRFDRYSWEELPEMHEGRSWATAVVC